ncbi:MAG: rhodanese-like domain-containing protein [Eubacteriales bacterium]
MNDPMIYIAIGIVVFIVFKMIGNIGGNKISQSKAKEMMNDDVVILDVREKYEYATGHIKNAVNLPLGSIQTNINKVVKDKEKTLLVYCASGARSTSATRMLHSLGYKNAYNFGGIASWQYGIVR